MIVSSALGLLSLRCQEVLGKHLDIQSEVQGGKELRVAKICMVTATTKVASGLPKEALMSLKKIYLYWQNFQVVTKHLEEGSRLHIATVKVLGTCLLFHVLLCPLK